MAGDELDAFGFLGYVFGAVAAAGEPGAVRVAFEDFKHDHVEQGALTQVQAAQMEQGWSAIRRRPDWPRTFATIGWRHARARDVEVVPDFWEGEEPPVPPMFPKEILLRMMASFADRLEEINPEQRRIFDCAEALDELGPLPLGRPDRSHLMMRGLGAIWAALAHETGKRPPFHEFAVARDAPTTSRYAVEFLLDAGAHAWRTEGWAAVLEAADAMPGGRLDVHLRMMRSMCEHVDVLGSARAARVLAPWMVAIGLLPDRWGERTAHQAQALPTVAPTTEKGLRLVARTLAAVLVGKPLTERHTAHLRRAMHRMVPPDVDIEAALMLIDDELAPFEEAAPRTRLGADLRAVAALQPRVRAKLTRTVQSVLDRRGCNPTKRLDRLQEALGARPFKVQGNPDAVVEPLRMMRSASSSPEVVAFDVDTQDVSAVA